MTKQIDKEKGTIRVRSTLERPPSYAPDRDRAESFDNDTVLDFDAMLDLDNLDPSDFNDNITHPIDSNEKEKEKAELENISPAELVEKTLEREDLKERIEQAIDDCEFETTPEVQKAIGDYKDHTLMMLVANELTSLESPDDVKSEEFNDLLDACKDGVVSDGIKKDIEKFQSLARRDDFDLTNPKGKVNDEARNFLKELASPLVEDGVGITTITDEEKLLIKNVGENINNWCEAMDVKNDDIKTSAAAIDFKINKAREDFWEDIRHAGDLLFHATPFANQVMADGNLRTRTSQERVTGEYNASTADLKEHAPAISWSESFLAADYRLPQSNGNKDMESYRKERHFAQVLAMPIEEVVRVTPFGRGGEYGSGGIKDSSKDDALFDAVEYNSEVIAGGFSGTPDSSPAAASISAERRFAANSSGENVYDYSHNIYSDVSYDGSNKAFWLKSRDKSAENFNAASAVSGYRPVEQNNPVGENFPTTVVVNEETSFENLAENESPLSDNEIVDIENKIKQVKERSINDPQYKGKFVFRLRGNTGLDIPG